MLWKTDKMNFKVIRSKNLLLQFVVLSLLLLRCNKEEPIPSYIHIDSISLTTIPSTEGSRSNKIVDAWVYIDDQQVGAFEMPFTVPVLYQGTHSIKVLPGIKENGIANTRIDYPFYNRYEQQIVLTPGKIDTVKPTTTYKQGINFIWMDDFEGAASSICDTLNSDTIMKIVRNTPEVFEGSGSGAVFLGTGTNTYFGQTCNKYVLSKTSQIFLELNYNCNTAFNVGIVAYDQSNITLGTEVGITINANNEWNKIYVNLSEEVMLYPNAARYSIFFSMKKNSNISLSYFYVDNVKLIYQ